MCISHVVLNRSRYGSGMPNKANNNSFQSLGCEGLLTFVSRFPVMDLPVRPWHSGPMRHRHPVRQLLLAIVLSHVLAIQGLLLAASGGLAFAAASAGGLTLLCSGATPANDDGTGSPLDQSKHRDCLDACLSARTSGESPQTSAILPLSAANERSDAPQEASLAAVSRARAFLARAPPNLT